MTPAKPKHRCECRTCGGSWQSMLNVNVAGALLELRDAVLAAKQWTPPHIRKGGFPDFEDWRGIKRKARAASGKLIEPAEDVAKRARANAKIRTAATARRR